MIKSCSVLKISQSFLSNLNYSYVRKKEIDQICAGYGESKLDKIKMYSRMFAHIGKEGFFGVKRDIGIFQQLRKKPKTEYSPADWNELIRLHHDFYRLGPLVIIQILPMSGPLFVLYMYTYPGSIPSWFIIDKFHEDYEKKIRVVQKQAVNYFQSRNVQPADINFDNMTLQEARRLAECLYGYYRDGTIGYKKLFKKDIPYFISESFSKYLIKRKLRYKFNADLRFKDMMSNMTFDQKIRWKYERVVFQGKHLKDYEEILSAEELKARKQVWAEEDRMQAEGDPNPNIHNDQKTQNK